MTAVLAMMYLVLFSTLALGFFATMTSSAQLSGNDQRGIEARLAAESGLHFIKWHLADMQIPKSTPPAQILAATYDQLSARLDGTTNMKGQTVGVSGDGTKLYVPGPADAYVSVDGQGMEFRATIERFGDWGLRVTTVGRANPSSTVSSNVRGGRGVQVDFSNRTQPGTMFNYGVASKSAIGLSGTVRVVGGSGDLGLASFLSTSSAAVPVSVGGSAVITGDVTTTGAAPVVSSSAKVGNVSPSDPSFSDHVHTIAPDDVPDFPVIDTSQFIAFAPPKGSTGPGVLNTATPAAGTYRNIRIPAGLNPTFPGGGVVLEGVVVIEHPNQVKFTSDCQIKGVIVSECSASDDNNQALVDADMANGVMDNWVHFGGQVTTVGVENLDPNEFPESLRELTGSLMLIPGFKAIFRGGTGNAGGAIIASGMDWGGNSGGGLNASIINVAPNVPFTMAGNQTITIEGHGNGSPAGVRFISHFAPEAFSYREVRP